MLRVNASSRASPRQLWKSYSWSSKMSPRETGCHLWLTIGGELVPLEHGDTEDFLLQVSDEELAVGVPLRVQGVLDGLSDVTLRAHGHLAVRIAPPWREH